MKNKMLKHPLYRGLHMLMIGIGLTIAAIHPLAAQTPDTVRFIHLSDPHICFLERSHPHIQSSRDHYGHGVAALEDFLAAQSAQPGIDFISITGDMIDYYDAHTAAHTVEADQIGQFLPILDKSQVPVYLTIGNHDIASYAVDESGKLVSTQYQAETARAAWVRKAPSFAGGTYYSRVVPVGSATYRLIFLDNGYYATNRSPDDDVFYVGQEQLDWLGWQLKQSADEKIIIFMHMPFKPDRPNESTGGDLFELLGASPAVELVLCGHRHVNEIHRFQGNGAQGFTQVMTGAFGRDTNHWRLVTLTESGITVSAAGSTEQALHLP